MNDTYKHIEEVTLKGYRWKCDKCKKVITSLYKGHLEALIDQHMLGKHKGEEGR